MAAGDAPRNTVDGGSTPSAPAFGPLAAAGFASLGAGAIHAAAAAAHGDHPRAALCFEVLALAQIGWGVWATVAVRRAAAAVGAALGAAAVGGWVVAQTVGLGFIAGLETPHGLGWADVLAAGLATVAFVGSARLLLADRPGTAHPVLRMAVATIAAVATLAGVSQSTAHDHGGTEAAGGHVHDAAPGAGTTPGGGHDHDDGSPVLGGHNHGASAAVPPAAYEAEDGQVDLSGVPGVTPAQQQRAEALVERTLQRLPQFADAAAAEAQGFRSIGDGFTGFEHLINWSYIDDDHVLDPDFPESLVYDTRDGGRKLVSAMFMLRPGTTLAQVPDVGGTLTQWHIHDNLCFSDDPVAPSVRGVTDADGRCRPPTRKLDPVPMVHVWIVPNRCGPFAALEGIAAGQVADGATHACDEQHGGMLGG